MRAWRSGVAGQREPDGGSRPDAAPTMRSMAAVSYKPNRARGWRGSLQTNDRWQYRRVTWPRTHTLKRDSVPPSKLPVQGGRGGVEGNFTSQPRHRRVRLVGNPEPDRRSLCSFLIGQSRRRIREFRVLSVRGDLNGLSAEFKCRQTDVTLGMRFDYQEPGRTRQYWDVQHETPNPAAAGAGAVIFAGTPPAAPVSGSRDRPKEPGVRAKASRIESTTNRPFARLWELLCPVGQPVHSRAEQGRVEPLRPNTPRHLPAHHLDAGFPAGQDPVFPRHRPAINLGGHVGPS